MRRVYRQSLVFLLLMLVGLGCAPASRAQSPSSRIALVIGNGAYRGAAANATGPNDAGLVAQTLTAGGFDVTGVRDLDGEGTRKAFRDFLDRAAQLGPKALAFVYLAGYGVQYSGDNYFVPVDATLDRDTDVPIQAIRVADLTQALAGLPIQSRVVVLDAAYSVPFPAGKTLPGGLALATPEAETLLAFNAAPGTVGPTATGSYGVYSQALAEMMRQGGVPVQEVFDRVRLRVNAMTNGADVPWDASKLTTSFAFLQASPDAPPPPADQVTYSTLEKRPIREFPAQEAYSVAVARDTFQGYQDFLAAFGTSPYARRVRILLAARREALTWRKTVDLGTGDAYWSYLHRYSRGPHAGEARRRLRALSLALTPPQDFAPVEYDVPPPPEQEYVYADEPTFLFTVPDEPPPPPPPIYILPAPDYDYDDAPPPPPSIGPGFLPIPIPIPIPFARPFGDPGRLRPPPGVPGSYAQPQPFMLNPQGQLRPQPGSVAPTVQGQPAAAPSAAPQLGAPGLAPPRQPAAVPGSANVPPSAQPGPAASSRTGQPLHLLPGQPLAQQPGAPPSVPAANRPVPAPALVQPSAGSRVLPNAGRPAALPGTPGAVGLPPRPAAGQPAGVTPLVPSPPIVPASRPAVVPTPVPQSVVPARPLPSPGASPTRPLPAHPAVQGQPTPVVPPGPAGPQSQPKAAPRVLPNAGRPTVVAPSQQAVPATVVHPLVPPPAAPRPAPTPAASPAQNAAQQQRIQLQQRQQQEQQRAQQIQQQQRQQQDQQRAQQIQQQQRQQQEQQRAQQIQQQQRQQQEQQRAQQIQQQQHQQQQRPPQPQAPAPRPGPAAPLCGKPGLPPCR